MGLARCGRLHRRGLGLGLRLGLHGRRGRRWLGREKVLVAEEGDERQCGEDHHGAHIAAATAAGARRLKIGIANFGQRILPIVKEGRTVRPPLLLW